MISIILLTVLGPKGYQCIQVPITSSPESAHAYDDIWHVHSYGVVPVSGLGFNFSFDFPYLVSIPTLGHM